MTDALQNLFGLLNLNDTAQTLIRSLLKVGAGALLAKGYVDQSQAEAIIAGGAALFAVLWGVMHRKQPAVPAPTATPIQPAQ